MRFVATGAHPLEIHAKKCHTQSMDIFAIIFAVFMIAAAVAATLIVGLYAGGWIGALAFAGLLILIYRAFTYQAGEDRSLWSSRLNAFQQPLADDHFSKTN